MRKRTWVFWGVALAALAGVAFATKTLWSPDGAVAQAPRGQQAPRAIPVEVAKAVKKKVPVRYDALGTVTPISVVQIKSRIETEISSVHFADGALIKEGDRLFTLDSRVLQAQIRQAEGILARDKAQLEAAERDVKRYTELVAKNATPITNLDTAKTAAETARANIQANEAALENLRVQLTYTAIHAPISGRIGMPMVKRGNFVRPSDLQPMATIVQIAPIYVAFAVPQRMLSDIRDALAEGTTRVEAQIPGETKRSSGRLAMVDNTVDPQTGMITIRAIADNTDEMLWPGTLVNTQLTLRVDEAVTVPGVAIQSGQRGTFVFVVKDGAAFVQPVQVSRMVDEEAVIGTGLNGDETVVTDGHLLLSNGTRVAPRRPQAGT